MHFVFRPRFPVDMLPPPLPEGDPRSERAAEMTDWWRSLFGEAVSCTADLEDWHENASQLRAAVSTGRGVIVMDPSAPPRGWSRVPGGDDLRSGELFRIGPVDDGGPFAVVGSLRRGDDLLDRPGCLWPDRDAERAANAYAASRAFSEQAGRAFRLTWVPGDEHRGQPGLPEAVRGLLDAGHQELAVKIVAQAKYDRPARLDLEDPSPEGIRSALIEALDYSMVHLEAVPDAFLVQEWVPDLQDEYRIVVVDGEPVAGAGCIESHTPLDNGGMAFDPAVEGARGSGEIRRDPVLVDRYVEAAREACRLLREERGPAGIPVDMTLDYACRADGGLVLIEANPLMNYGLYALDTVRMMASVAGAVARRAATPERGSPKP